MAEVLDSVISGKNNAIRNTTQLLGITKEQIAEVLDDLNDSKINRKDFHEFETIEANNPYSGAIDWSNWLVAYLKLTPTAGSTTAFLELGSAPQKTGAIFDMILQNDSENNIVFTIDSSTEIRKTENFPLVITKPTSTQYAMTIPTGTTWKFLFEYRNDFGWTMYASKISAI